jgi:hypothetical protein
MMYSFSGMDSPLEGGLQFAFQFLTGFVHAGEDLLIFELVESSELRVGWVVASSRRGRRN